MPTCPKCQAPQPETNAFCDRCGAAITPAAPAVNNARICAICRTPAQPGQDFCPNCGAPFNNPGGNRVTPDVPHCSQCGQPVNSAVGYCDRCGAALTPPPAARPCPRCGAANALDSRFCESCGQKLEPALNGIAAAGSLPPTVKIPVGGAKNSEGGLPPTVKIPAGSQDPTQPVIPPISAPRLVVLGTAAVLPLPVGKIQWIVGRKDPTTGAIPDVDLTSYGGEAGGVSRRHARIVRQGDQMFIEDLNTINHSYLNSQCLAPGKLYLLNEGDEIRLGRIKLTFYIQPHPDTAGRSA